MLALGVSVEGCSEYMTPLMSQVWPVIEAGLQDGDAGVRRATCVAVSCLCEWLEDECVSRHAVLVPVRPPTIRLSSDVYLTCMLRQL
jgi:importin-4